MDNLAFVQMVPNTIRGAILGFAYHALSNSGALYVTFKKSGVPLALARVFEKVSGYLE